MSEERSIESLDNKSTANRARSPLACCFRRQPQASFRLNVGFATNRNQAWRPGVENAANSLARKPWMPERRSTGSLGDVPAGNWACPLLDSQPTESCVAQTGISSAWHMKRGASRSPPPHVTPRIRHNAKQPDAPQPSAGPTVRGSIVRTGRRAAPNASSPARSRQHCRPQASAQARARLYARSSPFVSMTFLYQ